MQRKRQCCSQWKEKNHLADTHHENSDKIVPDCVESVREGFSARTHPSMHVRIRTTVWMGRLIWGWVRAQTVLVYMCAGAPACHLCVCVDNVVIDCRRPVVRVAVVTRRLCWLHWVKSSSSGCLCGDLGESGSSSCSVPLRFALSLNIFLCDCLSNSLSVSFSVVLHLWSVKFPKAS